MPDCLIKHLCLDVGNVLAKFNYEAFIKELSIKTNFSEQDCRYFLTSVQKTQDLGISDLKDEFRFKLGIKSEGLLEDALHSWNNNFNPDYQMLEVIKELQSELDLKIAILSNMGPEHISKIKPYLDNAIVAEYYFSSEVGARKPTSIYYQSFLAKYPEFKGALYIDDLIGNLEAGEKFGFKTLHIDLSKSPSALTVIEELNFYEEIKRNIKELLSPRYIPIDWFDINRDC